MLYRFSFSTVSSTTLPWLSFLDLTFIKCLRFVVELVLKVLYYLQFCLLNQHCVKSVQIRSFFWSECRKKRTRKNSVFGYFLRSAVNTYIFDVLTKFMKLTKGLMHLIRSQNVHKMLLLLTQWYAQECLRIRG